MCRQIFLLTFIVLMLCSVSKAEDIKWTDLGADHLWSNPENWDLGRVPTLADEVLIDVPAAGTPNGPVILDGIDAKAKGIWTEAPGEPTLTITGGTLEVAEWIWWRDGADTFGIWDMSGGAVTVGSEFELGWGGGAGTLIMTGGKINAEEAVIPTDSESFGELYLYGGTYNVTKANGLSVKENGLINITKGTLVLEGDDTAKINDLIAVGRVTAYGGNGQFEMDFDVRNPGKTTLSAVIKVIVFLEDFEDLPLGPNVDEAFAGEQVWTDIPPADWIVDESGIPGIGDPATDGVTEWAGWAFTDKAWWTETAGDQNRSEFELGSGTVAVADPDEWDDADHTDSEASGWYKTFLTTPTIDISGFLPGTLQLKFDSSWRPEFDSNYHQTANITASFDGGDPVEVMLWESDEASANYKPYATNETVTVDLGNPAGAMKVVLAFGLFDAGDDWWWAIDNVEVSGLPIDRLNPTMFGYEDPLNLIHTVKISKSGEELSYTVGNIPDDWFKWNIKPQVVKEEPNLPVLPYVYHGDAAEYTPDGVGSLDGTWSHDNVSDEWDGTGPGEGAPGGAAALFEDDVTFLRIQDTGDPRDYGMGDPGSNRKIYLTHAIDFALDGAVLEFRARLATSPPLDDEHPDGGVGIVPWPDGGIGYQIRDNGKGMFGISDGVGIISFSLARAGEPGFEEVPTDVLVMNNLVGSEPSDDVDTGDAATAVNTIDVNDVTQWNTFVIYIFPGGAGTHIVSVSVNDGPAEIFEVTVGTGIESENPYISIGSSGTGGITAFDVDYFSGSPNERVDFRLLEWLADDPDQEVPVIVTLDSDLDIPRFPELPDGVTRDSPEGQALIADIEAEIERLTAVQRVFTEQFVSDANERFEIDLPILEQYWLVSGFLTNLRLRDVLDLARMDRLFYVQPRFGGEPPPQGDSTKKVYDGRAEINSDPCFNTVNHVGFNIALLDTGILSTHVLFNNPSRIGYLFDAVTSECNNPFFSESDTNDVINHGTSSAAIIVGNDNLGDDYRGVTAMTLDSYNVYTVDPNELDSHAACRALECNFKSLAGVIVAEIQAREWPYGGIALKADAAFDAGKAIIAANGNYDYDEEKEEYIPSHVRSPALAHKVIGVGAYDIVTQEHYVAQTLGPTYDHRYKPDLQAPMNTETASSDSNTGLRIFDGTSGSTPYAAGAAALIRKWLVWHNTRDPGSTYVFLINAGTRGWPDFNNTSGVGRINLQFPVNVWMKWGKVEFSPGMAIDFEINIPSNIKYLHAALWWPEDLRENHDDVDLYLIDPSKQVLAESNDPNGGVFEFARVPEPIAGQWTFRIEAYEINSGPQIVYWTATWHKH